MRRKNSVKTGGKHDVIAEGRPTIKVVRAPEDNWVPMTGGGRTKVPYSTKGQ